MARLRDVPHVLRTVGPFTFAKRVWNQGSEDQLMTWAAAMAYSWLFAVFPFLVFLMTFIPNLPDKQLDTVKRELKQLIYTLPNKDAADALWTNLDTQLINRPTGHGVLRYVGLGLALWAASGGMATTMYALDRCYELREGRGYFRHRFAAMVMTVVVATLIVLVTLLLPVAGILKEWVIRQSWEGFGRTSPMMIAFDIARWALASCLLVFLLTVLYHWGPYVKHRFHVLTPGAIFTIVVWIGLGIAFKVYFGRFASYNKTYGTVGGAAAILLIFYIDAAVLLLGAEINSEIDFEVLKIQRGQRNFIPAEAEAEGEFVGPLASGSNEPVSPTDAATTSL